MSDADVGAIDDFERQIEAALSASEYSEARHGSVRGEFDATSTRIGRHPNGGYIYLGQLLAFVDRLLNPEMYSRILAGPPPTKPPTLLGRRCVITIDGIQIDMTGLATAAQCAEAITAQSKGVLVGRVTPEGHVTYRRATPKTEIETVSNL